MSGILFLGFLIGMAHALEADHLAAVGAMGSAGPNPKRRLILRGAVWGLGHTLTLFIVCSGVLLLGFSLTERVSAVLEFSVGVMLVLLGMDVLRQMLKKRVHFHVHTHGEGKPHLHAHTHVHAVVPHDEDDHVHAHPEPFPYRALLIGLVHGAAGSAGLLALSVAATRDPAIALGYIAVFGLGSILGMAALSLVVMWPLGAAEKHTRFLHGGLYTCIGFIAIYFGVSTMAMTGAVAFAEGG